MSLAYFSVSGVTKNVATKMASGSGADLFEIVPETLYTKDDLNYLNPNSRSTVEMKDLNARPAVACKVENIAAYDTVCVGFPVWWGREPSIVDTFLEENDLSGKTIIPFCTSGGGNCDGATKRITELCMNATVKTGFRLEADVTEEALKECLASL